jgi:hypothetical protein
MKGQILHLTASRALSKARGGQSPSAFAGSIGVVGFAGTTAGAGGEAGTDEAAATVAEAAGTEAVGVRDCGSSSGG